jgi:hypothetical protein
MTLNMLSDMIFTHKHFVNNIGAHPALCYANAYPSEDSRSQRLHYSELMDKV